MCVFWKQSVVNCRTAFFQLRMVFGCFATKIEFPLCQSHTLNMVYPVWSGLQPRCQVLTLWLYMAMCKAGVPWLLQKKMWWLWYQYLAGGFYNWIFKGWTHQPDIASWVMKAWHVLAFPKTKQMVFKKTTGLSCGTFFSKNRQGSTFLNLKHLLYWIKTKTYR